jgi:hypothetical protein
MEYFSRCSSSAEDQIVHGAWSWANAICDKCAKLASWRPFGAKGEVQWRKASLKIGVFLRLEAERNE